jgi:DNA-binding winged helix-turn-helix (wHTH) protein/tetratricopeptide (TPR) repeat protein
MDKPTTSATVFAFAGFELDEVRCELRRGGQPVALEPKTFDLLAFLVRHRHRVVSKDELFRAVWPEVVVSDSALTNCLWAARKALRDAGEPAPSIQTVHRRGYRFALAVEERVAPEAAGATRAPLPLPPALARARAAPFVGRAAALDALRAGLARAARGQGGVVLLGGEAGIGKTRLVAELAADPAAARFRVCYGACDEIAGAAAYAPFVEALAPLRGQLAPAALTALLGDDAAWIARVVPALAPSRTAVPEAPPHQERYLVFGSVARLIDRLARMQPVLLILEDLHWADEATRLLARFLARRIGAAPVLLAGTYRHTDVPQAHGMADLLADAQRESWGAQVTLGGLARDAVAELLRAAAGSEPPPVWTEVMTRVTEGNPLFIREFLTLLRADGFLLAPAGGWREPPPEGLAVPYGVQALLRRRWARLSAASRDVLATAAVMGQTCRYDLLAAATGLDGHHVLAAVEEAEAAYLIRGTPQERHVELAFTHDLIRRTLYEDLSLPRRQALHGRIAAALEGSETVGCRPPAAELAYHYRQAGSLADPRCAARALIAAGDQATAASAFEDAVRHYAGAHELLAADTPDQAALLLKLANAEYRAGDGTAAVANFERAVAACERLGDTARVEEGCLSLALLRAGRGEFAAVQETVARGLAAAPTSQTAARARLLIAAARWLVLAGQRTLAEQWLDAALEIARVRDDRALRGAAQAAQGTAQWCYTAFRTAAATLAGAATGLHTAGDLAGLMLCRIDHLIALGYLGRLDDMADGLREQRRLAEKLGDPGALAVHALLGGVLAFVRGALADAHRAAERAVAETQRAAIVAYPAALQLLAEVEFACGRAERIDALFSEAEGLNRLMGEPPARYVGPLSSCFARAWRGEAVDGGALDGVLPPPPAAGAVLSCAQLDGMLLAGLTLAEAGRAAAAAPYYAALARQAAGGTVFGGGAYPLVQRVLGVIAAGSGWADRASEHYALALRQAETQEARKEAAETLYWSARAARDRHDARQARALARRAAAAYEAIGMPLHHARAAALARAKRKT